jgi:RHS repeat-associated protein
MTYIYSYDKNGNTSSKTNKTTNEYTKYYWNAENQMTRLEKYTQAGDTIPTSTAKYIYDGLGRRVAKNVDNTVTKYLYDQEDILLELDETDTILARYTHGPGIDEPLSLDKDAQSYYYIADGLGSIVKLMDTAGTVVNNYTYDAFGNIVEKTEGVANPYTYTAREYDAESGLYYYRFRYYDAKIGRFLSEDPIGFWAGVNFYVYVGNNPINWIDPFGFHSLKYDKDDQIFYILDDNGNIFDSWPAVSGIPGRFDPLPTGPYDVGNPVPVSANPYCDSSGNCWWVPITPQFDTKSTGLGIHPDGNIYGTEGCIGVLCDDTGILWEILNEHQDWSLEVVEKWDGEKEDGCGQ